MSCIVLIKLAITHGLVQLEFSKNSIASAFCNNALATARYIAVFACLLIDALQIA